MRVLQKTWINITHTEAVQSRLNMAQNAIAQEAIRAKRWGTIPKALPYSDVSDQICTLLPAEIKGKAAAYLFSSGDLFPLISINTRRVFYLDKDEFFNQRVWQSEINTDAESMLSLMLGNVSSLDHITGHECNYYKETGIFALAETLLLGADNLRVYQEESNRPYYLLTFNVKDQAFQIVFCQEWILPGKQLEILKNLDIGVILINGRNTLTYKIDYEGYFQGWEYLQQTAQEFPAGCYLVCLSYKTPQSPSLAAPPTFSLIGKATSIVTPHKPRDVFIYKKD